MDNFPYRNALIVGAGSGISASLARNLSKAGVKVGLSARNIEKLDSLVNATGAKAFAADASKADQVAELFAQVDVELGEPDVVIYNASFRASGPLTSIDPSTASQAIAVTAYGAFLVAQQAAIRMERKGHGAILFTGATAGIKGFARSAPFAMGKFALRGLAQSAARELAPLGIHVAYFNIDGAVRSADSVGVHNQSDNTIDPDAVAETYLSVLAQPRNAWTHEIDLRPWSEPF